MSVDISKVTRRPWAVDDSDVTGNDGDTLVAVMFGDGLRGSDMEPPRVKANAAHIVHCVNAHDELVEALENVIRAWDLDRDEVAPDDYERVEKARALLAKVKP